VEGSIERSGIDKMIDEDGDAYAKLTAARRVWAIGAVHGEAGKLKDLHRELSARAAPGDRFVYLGNLIGYGAQIVETLDEALRFRRVMFTPGMESGDFAYLRGSQEEMWTKLLQIQFAPNPREVFEWMIQQGVEATLAAYGGRADEGRSLMGEGAVAITRWTNGLRTSTQRRLGHDEILNSVKRAAFTENGKLLLVHAGLDPHRPLSQQGDTLWWGSGYFSGIDGAYGDVKMIVRGYDRRHDGLAMNQWTATVDAGCGFGGRLAAACFLPDGSATEWIEI
jgi:serine/threonine protein phosphatase 1